MIKKTTYKGSWFLPDNEVHVGGILEFDTKGNGKLDLMGIFNEVEVWGEAFQQFDYILGVTATGTKITLYKCSECSRTTTNGNRTSIYSILYIIEGNHYGNNSEFKFNKIACVFKNINKWVNKFGFEIQRDYQKHAVELKFEKPENIEFTIGSGLQGRIYFDYFYPLSDRSNKITIEQQAVFELISDESISFFEMMDNLMLFQNFLTLGTQEPAFPMSINIYSKKEPDGGYKRSKVNYKPGFDYTKESSDYGYFLFYLTDIEKKIDSILKTWYELRTDLEPVTNLLFDNYYTSYKNPENQFLNNIQALETFHRRIKDYKPFPKLEYKAWVDDLIPKVDEKYQELLRGKLNFGNEPPLHKRLEELLDNVLQIEFISKIIPDRGQLIKDTKNSRNYYTHYDSSLSKKSLKGYELRMLSEKLKLVLICVILNHTGFSTEDLNNLLSRYGIYLFNHLLREED